MGRNLPWANSKPSASKAQRGSSADSREKKPRHASPIPQTQSSSRGQSVSNNSRALVPGAHIANRTPSSSPPPAPPASQQEQMLEGYDGDDIYIMVEDEFQEVAQHFTKHLHAAEYKRLLKQAREAPKRPLPESTSHSGMSKEAERALNSAALRTKQNSTLERLMGGLPAEENEKAETDDLWAGTSLAPLMTSGSQQKRSLIGLQRMSSSTRAGMGFGRAELDGPRKSQETSSFVADDTLDRLSRPSRINPAQGVGHTSYGRNQDTTVERSGRDKPSVSWNSPSADILSRSSRTFNRNSSTPDISDESDRKNHPRAPPSDKTSAYQSVDALDFFTKPSARRSGTASSSRQIDSDAKGRVNARASSSMAAKPISHSTAFIETTDKMDEDDELVVTGCSTAQKPLESLRSSSGTALKRKREQAEAKKKARIDQIPMFF